MSDWERELRATLTADAERAPKAPQRWTGPSEAYTHSRRAPTRWVSRRPRLGAIALAAAALIAVILFAVASDDDTNTVAIPTNPAGMITFRTTFQVHITDGAKRTDGRWNEKGTFSGDVSGSWEGIDSMGHRSSDQESAVYIATATIRGCGHGLFTFQWTFPQISWTVTVTPGATDLPGLQGSGTGTMITAGSLFKMEGTMTCRPDESPNGAP